ncbi:MAG: hypothetical protein QM767_04520 [Anaeromyxobacter sp.]
MKTAWKLLAAESSVTLTQPVQAGAMRTPGTAVQLPLAAWWA